MAIEENSEKINKNKQTPSPTTESPGKFNRIQIPKIELPEGGGAIKGIDEKFSVNAINGTSFFSLPLPISRARGATPELELSYNSGSGNGLFGLGWSLNLGSFKRKTDKGIPQYADLLDSDTFIFSEAEDLVPEYKKNADGRFVTDVEGEYVLNEIPSNDGLFKIRYYKPRIEGLFARIERWIEIKTGRIKWRVITRDNTTTLYGWTDQSIIANPQNPVQIFEWLPEFVFDDKGNCSHYLYRSEDSTGFDESMLHNRNRLKDGEITYSNTYIQKVLYGNITPYEAFSRPFPEEDDYLFSTVFDYGEYKKDSPYEKMTDWDYRSDAFSSYKAGFEVRTTRLCQRVFLFHHFKGPDEYEGLVRSLNFEYDTTPEHDFTFLKSATSFGYIKKPDGSYSYKKLPEMEFAYQKHDWNKEIKSLDKDDNIHAPIGLDEQQYQFTDFFNEGLSGILTEQANGWFYKNNLGNGKFERAKLVTPKPSFNGLGGQLQLADLDADGGKQVVVTGNGLNGYFELDGENDWRSYRSFKTYPTIDFRNPNIRMLDLNGDGRSDVVISEDNIFTWYQSEGRKGYTSAKKNIKSIDEESGPHMVFADSSQSIFLADISGDGMTDILRIRNSEVCYWPNLGYGKFGSKIAMDNAPVFDHPDAFNPSLLRLADIDGSGTSDIIYLGKNKFTCWKNLSGNRFSEIPFEIDNFPQVNEQARVTVTDLLGNGVPCIVWSSPLSEDTHAPLKYIDLMNSKKPHIMVSYKNNLGKEVSLEYTPSTKFYIEDKQSGNPWVTKLHFPVHCVSKTITEDKISGSRFVREYKYHHGYYDHTEKEFRGFGMVEQIDAETYEHWVKQDATNVTEEKLHQEPTVSKSWFHTGAFLKNGKILHQFEKDYWYEKIQVAGFPVTHHEVDLSLERLIGANGIEDSIIDNLSSQEWREALRACKGMSLRSETFAKDAKKFGNTEEARRRELTPFSVSSHNFVIELLQPKGKNKHAVFVVKQSEDISYNYERNPEDPRISHSLNIKLDDYANILESASVVYPRKIADSSLPLEIQKEQARTTILYTENRFTNDVLDEHVHRLRLPSEMKTYELKGVTKLNAYYLISDFQNILSDTNSDQVHYHEVNKPLSGGRTQRRLIEHIRTVYYQNDLKAAMPLHQLDSLALSHNSYQLAYTPELLTDIFEDRISDGIMTEGKFTHSENDENWWIRSGKANFKEVFENRIDAAKRFYVPISYTDPFGAITRVSYYGSYFLFIEETEDALGNRSGGVKFNFRTLSPKKMKDINNNLSEVVSDELGLIKAVAVLGKGNEADDLIGISEITDTTESVRIGEFFQATDSVELSSGAKNLLKHASNCYVYDLDAYTKHGRPTVVVSISREQHFQEMANSPVQIAFEYSNGQGEVLLKKVQAEPGSAKRLLVEADNSITIDEINTADITPVQLRWIGNGRTIKNNKGNPVKQYEPYFSITWHFEHQKELVETGVTPIMYYDAAGRLIRTDLPDGTFSKVEFDSWKKTAYDASDAVLESEWYLKRTDNTRADFINDPKEQITAGKAAKHANTPNIEHVDNLGRKVLSIDHNKNLQTEDDEFYHTKYTMDSEGNLRSVTDARNNTVMEYKYDMQGNRIYQKSMDAGQRWLLNNILSKPFRTWDERNHEFQYFYDIAQRPIATKVLGGDGDDPLNHIFDRIFYGESLLSNERTNTNRFNEADLQAKNILGQVIKHFDTAGLIESPEFDFKGKPKFTNRKLFAKYKEVANWEDGNLNLHLESGNGYTFTTKTDALGRITRQTAPDGSTIIPSYNETGLLNAEKVLHFGSVNFSFYIKDIDYNEKGQRNKIIYGNNVSTRFYYDNETFRLIRLESKRLNGDILQDWYYTYDPVGNITYIEDKVAPIEFFRNNAISSLCTYTYNALYRLVEATGRESHNALNFGVCDNWNDKPFLNRMTPGDPMEVRNYTQQYNYDAVGNIIQMRHLAPGGNWTRGYEYETNNNRLKRTFIGDITNPANYTKYSHHTKHGFFQKLPHLEKIGWNFKEEVILTSRQHCTDDNIPVTTYYQYDGTGQRIRKISENQAVSGGTPTKKEERIYISGFEHYKKYSGANAGLERTCLSLMDKGHRFVMVETRNDVDDGTEKELLRYQLQNILGSTALELDGTADAKVISYEEYHPFGTTAYQAKSTTIKSAAKRYRYTGMERDEETGLEYHSARYYLPWLGRWLSADPVGIGDGVNIYNYCQGNPVMFNDSSGHQADETPTTSFGITIDSSGGTTVGPFLNLPGPGTSTPYNLSPEATCYGVHPTLGVYMQLGIGSECGAGGFSTSLSVGDAGITTHEPSASSTTTEQPIASANSTDTTDDGSVGEPGFWESLIPVWGSGREAVNHFQKGNYGRGLLWSALAVTDVFLVKSLVMGGGRLLFRTGSTLLARETETVAARATVSGLERAPSLTLGAADELVSAASHGTGWTSSGFGSGAEVLNLGEWWVKRTGPGNAFVRNFGAMGIEAQERGLMQLGDLGTEFFMRDGMIFTRSVGEAPTLFSRTFGEGWAQGSYRLGTVFNDIRPRNMGVGGHIFDPTLNPALHSLWWGTVYGTPRFGFPMLLNPPQ